MIKSNYIAEQQLFRPMPLPPNNNKIIIYSLNLQIFEKNYFPCTVRLLRG